MIKRSTWIMVIVLAVLAGLTYYMSVPDNFIKKAMEAGKTPTFVVLDKGLISSHDGAISAIELTSADGHTLLLKHEPTTWTISRDGQAAAAGDQSAIEQAASQAQGLQLINLEVKTTTTDLSGFGLDKPVYTYKVTLESGKIFNFKIGKATVIGDGYYLQKEDGKIAIVDKNGMDALLALFKQPAPSLTATP